MARGWRRAVTIELQFSDSLDHRKEVYIELTFKSFFNASHSTDSFDFRELVCHELLLGLSRTFTDFQEFFQRISLHRLI